MSDARTSLTRPPIVPRPELDASAHGPHGGPAGAGDLGRPVRADFSTSVNAYGPAPSVVAAVRAASDAAALGAYPDPTCHAARSALAARCGVAPDEVAVGAGAAELLLAVALAFVRPGDAVLVPPHAFGEYARAASLCGGRVEAASPRPDPADAVAPSGEVARAMAERVGAGGVRVAFLCTPESPTGRAWPRAAVAALADACLGAGTLLVLDQSYDAFAAHPLGTPALPGHAAVLHLRSLTKDHALPGLRVGHLVGPRRLVAAVERARAPWAVAAPAQAAVVAACAPEAAEHVRRTVAALRAEAAALRAGCAALGLAPPPSDAHYFLVPVGDAAAATRHVRERHALRLRDCTSFGLPGHVRVAARTPAENRLLLEALADVTDAPSYPPAPAHV